MDSLRVLGFHLESIFGVSFEPILLQFEKKNGLQELTSLLLSVAHEEVERQNSGEHYKSSAAIAKVCIAMQYTM